MKDLNILAIDTSMEACSASLLFDGKRVSEYEECPQQHSQKILPMVQSLFQSANCQLQNMDYLVFGRGPGSFTGVRIACGMTQGLAFGSDLKAIGISTLASMAYATGAKRIAVASDARMGEVYYGEYQQDDKGALLSLGESVVSPQDAFQSAQQFAPNVIAGTGWSAYPELAMAMGDIAATIVYPNAKHMLDLALQQLADDAANALAAHELEPVYLRDKVTWKKLPGRD